MKNFRWVQKGHTHTLVPEPASQVQETKTTDVDGTHSGGYFVVFDGKESVFYPMRGTYCEVPV